MRGANRTYQQRVDIGREASCAVQVQSGLVSRVHAVVAFDDGTWWVEDQGSTNGTFLDGKRIDRAPVTGEMELRLGENGPSLQLSVPTTSRPAAPSRASADAAPPADGAPAEGSTTQAEAAGRTSPAPSASPGRSAASSPSVTQYIERYFSDADRPAGEHTQMLRTAYQRVQKTQRRKYVWIVAGVVALCLVLAGYAATQHWRNQQLASAAEQVFLGMKEQDKLIVQLKRRIEESGNAPLREQLRALEQQRQQQQVRYAGYIEELGLYRALSAEEREIYQVARIFGESEFSIPAGFVREVRQTIDTYWKTPAGRSRLTGAIQRAEENGYTPFIVNTMRAHALPPEFFYLALQESNFDPYAIGPETRWGIAKGMWQFIPETAERYGLRIGPRADVRVEDPQDERHDFQKSTRAAARYLQTIFSTKAQASGLLVIASYNWGEHRVIRKLEQLPGPQGIPQGALEGIPENPEDRNYWRFLREYSDRMPEETKDYVLKIFSAAVIGHNPALFGFDFENPLQKYMEAPAAPQMTSRSYAPPALHAAVRPPSPTVSWPRR